VRVRRKEAQHYVDIARSGVGDDKAGAAGAPHDSRVGNERCVEFFTAASTLYGAATSALGPASNVANQSQWDGNGADSAGVHGTFAHGIVDHGTVAHDAVPFTIYTNENGRYID